MSLPQTSQKLNPKTSLDKYLARQKHFSYKFKHIFPLKIFIIFMKNKYWVQKDFHNKPLIFQVTITKVFTVFVYLQCRITSSCHTCSFKHAHSDKQVLRRTISRHTRMVMILPKGHENLSLLNIIPNYGIL